MALFGDKYCWMITGDPSVCPYIGQGEEHLFDDLELRIREKCLSCDELRNDLGLYASEKDSVFGVLSLILDELRKREQKLKIYGKSLEIKDEMFDILVHLSTSLKLVLDVEKIIYKGLVAFTVGSSFGFNRAVTMLSDGRRLSGYFALGPRDYQEALSIWGEITDKKLGLKELLVFSPQVFQKEGEKFRDILKAMDFDINENPFRNVFKLESNIRVAPEDQVPGLLRDFYGEIPFWIVPLVSHLRRPLGVIILDNFLTRKELSQEESKALDIFATEISLALERGRSYEELEEKVETLEEANVKLKEHQELITKLRAEASIGDLVFQLTHSFKNPIIAIAGLARVMNKRISPDLPISRHINAILEESIKLENTLKSFVNLTKTKFFMDKSQLNINNVVELIYQEKEKTGRRQGITFHLTLSEKIPQIYANDYQLYTCLENLLNNSIEAMPEGGVIDIETRSQNGSVSVEIRDTGPGIPEEVMKNLFTPFFTTKSVGSGLGLYTSKEIIEKMGGNISVSCNRDKGCKVILTLPVTVKE